MTDLLHDIAYACRTLRRAPGLVATAVLSLGLGIAATTTVFSFVNALQFKSLPFASADSLVEVEEISATRLCAGCAVGTSYPTFVDWQTRVRSFASLGAYEETRRVLGTPLDPERVPAAMVSANLFPLLGVQPIVGRGFTADDDVPGAQPVALLSDALWRRRFAADPRVAGSTMKVDGVTCTIVGVMPADFRFPEFAQFWMPLAPARHEQTRTERSLGIVARLKPGVN